MHKGFLHFNKIQRFSVQLKRIRKPRKETAGHIQIKFGTVKSTDKF